MLDASSIFKPPPPTHARLEDTRQPRCLKNTKNTTFWMQLTTLPPCLTSKKNTFFMQPHPNMMRQIFFKKNVLYHSTLPRCHKNSFFHASVSFLEPRKYENLYPFNFFASKLLF